MKTVTDFIKDRFYLYGQELVNRDTPIMFTHAGKFHADDVYATALLLLIHWRLNFNSNRIDPVSLTFNLNNRNFNDVDFNPINVIEKYVKRIPRNELDHYLKDVIPEDAILYDIGNTIYDHHDLSKAVYRDSHPHSNYAAFGLIFRELIEFEEANNKSVLGIDVKYLKKFDETFVMKIDQQDNWGPVLFPNDRSFDITIMNADDIYSEENDIRFARAVTFAMQILQNHFDFMRKQTVLDAKILKVIDDANVKGVNKVFLHEYLPAKAFENSSVHFVAFKGTDPSVDEWMLVSTNSSKYPIKEVEAGVDGCKFIHTAKFMATFNSEEACKKALERQ